MDVDERARAVLEPDTLLGSQYADRVRARREQEPERQLMFAVLELAVNDYLTYAGARDARRQALFRDAEGWVDDRDARWLYSFENVCNVLGLDPDCLREGLRARTARKTTGPEPDAPPAPEPAPAVDFRRSA
jgi:hypothetical protein